jgi:hypothetical protein
VFYVTFDVTKQLCAGTNAPGMVLGNGRFYSPRRSVYAGMPTADLPKLRLQLRLEHEDGTIPEVVSDESWKLTTDGSIITINVAHVTFVGVVVGIVERDVLEIEFRPCDHSDETYRQQEPVATHDSSDGVRIQ